MYTMDEIIKILTAEEIARRAGDTENADRLKALATKLISLVEMSMDANFANAMGLAMLPATLQAKGGAKQ